MSTIVISMGYAQFYASMFLGSLKFRPEGEEAANHFKSEIEDALPNFYAAVLVFSAKAKTYFQPTKTGMYLLLLFDINMLAATDFIL